jgi:hypothetical protein
MEASWALSAAIALNGHRASIQRMPAQVQIGHMK